jgi:Ca2+-binding RTX toxin-like protein
MTSAGHLSTGGSLVGPGTYTINVTATDQAANASSPVPVTIFVDANGANSITLSGSTNIAYGLNGSDTITGTSGFDAISGGNNNDRIIGGGSGDYLSGGSSADTFQYNAITDSTPGIVNNKPNYDTIGDFAATGGNHDTIDFTNIAGINTSGGVPTFQDNITGAGNLTLNAHSVAYIETGGNTEILVNTTNSNETVTISDVSAANMEIVLTGVSLGLTSADFHHV